MGHGTNAIHHLRTVEFDDRYLVLLDKVNLLEIHFNILCVLSKLLSQLRIPLDINQEIIFRRILLSVSGVIPSIEDKYCSGNSLNSSGSDLNKY